MLFAVIFHSLSSLHAIGTMGNSFRQREDATNFPEEQRKRIFLCNSSAEWMRIALVVWLSLCFVYLYSWREPQHCQKPQLQMPMGTESRGTLDLLCQFYLPPSTSYASIRSWPECDSYHFDAVLVSPGGVGSSTLFTNLSLIGLERLNNGSDRDGLKHGLYYLEMGRIDNYIKRKRQSNEQCATKLLIYTFDQAAASVFSLYRRNFHLAHNKKLHKTPFPAGCFPNDVVSYSNINIDFLGLEDHFMSWVMGGLCDSEVPVVLLRSSYRSNSDAIQAVSESLMEIYSSKREIDIDTLTPKLKTLMVEDSHYLLGETAASFQKLQKFYAGFQKKLDSLGYMTVLFNGKYKRLV